MQRFFNFNNIMIYIILSQTKVRLTDCSDSTVQDRKEPVCYIHLKEVGGSNEYWAKMYGENALLVFKSGQKVEAELSFHVYKNSRKRRQRVEVKKISLVKDKWYDSRMPWDY